MVKKILHRVIRAIIRLIYLISAEYEIQKALKRRREAERIRAGWVLGEYEDFVHDE